MNRYHVFIVVEGTYCETVEAPSRDDAKRIALSHLQNVSLLQPRFGMGELQSVEPIEDDAFGVALADDGFSFAMSEEEYK